MFKDSTKKKKVGGMSAPKLHGHTRIEFYNEDGELVKVQEKDNLVTPAVSDMFQENILGVIDYDDLTPVRNLFGGCLAFYDALDENEITFPSPLSNKCQAWAGQTAHATASKYRGNPNNAPGGSEELPNGYKFVWDWQTNQLDSPATISALALTHKDFGDIGLGPNPKVPSETPYWWTTNRSVKLLTGNRSTRGNFGDYLHGLICIVDDGAVGYCYDSANSKMKKVALAYKGQSINSTLAGASVISEKTVSFAVGSSGGITWDASTDKFYAVSFPDSSSCVIAEYDYDTEAVTTKTFNNGLSITSVSIDSSIATAAQINKFAKSGNYFFIYANSGIVRLDWNNPSDVEAVSLTDYDGTFTPDVVNFGQLSIGDGIVIASGVLIAGLKAYAITTKTSTDVYGLLVDATQESYMGNTCIRHALTAYPHIQVVWVWCYGQNADRVITLYAGVQHSPYLATIQNLEDVETKDSTMSMKVSYTITQATT